MGKISSRIGLRRLCLTVTVLLCCLQTASCQDSKRVINPEPNWRVTYRDILPVWSPDGSKILYYHDDPDSQVAAWCLYDVATGKSEMLDYPMLIREPSWSPDGRWLAFGWNRQIFAMKLNGDSLRQLTFNENGNFFASWSPCGSLIAYSQSGGVDRGLWLVDFATGRRKLISLFGDGLAVGTQDVTRCAL